MLKGFFFYWVHIDDARIGVRDGVQLPLYVCLSLTSSPSVRDDDTFVWAGAALHCTFSQCLVEIGFMNVRVCCGKPLFRPCQIQGEQHRTTRSTKSGSDEISA